MYILRRGVQKLKNIFSPTTLLLRYKPVELNRSLSPFWKLEMSMLLCMFGYLYLDKKIKNMQFKKE